MASVRRNFSAALRLAVAPIGWLLAALGREKKPLQRDSAKRPDTLPHDADPAPGESVDGMNGGTDSDGADGDGGP